MAIVGIVLLMILAIIAGRSSKVLGMKQYAILVLLALCQVAVVMYYLYNLQPPEM